MRKKHAAAIAILALVGIPFWILLGTGKREPVYEGKPLSYWLSDFWPNASKATPHKLQHDRIAVRDIGTNAIPILLEWIAARDGPLKKRMVTWISQHPRVPFRILSSIDKNMLACSGFSILGTNQAASAVPSLVEIVRNGRGEKMSPNGMTFAMWSLRELAPEAATKAQASVETNPNPISVSTLTITTNK